MSAFKRLGKRASRILIIEGIPGAGKSAFIRSLKEYLVLVYAYEVVELSEDIPPAFLDLYLGGPDKRADEPFRRNMREYAFAFQIHMATERRVKVDRALDIVRRAPNIIVLMDRSPFGDCAFAYKLNADGLIRDEAMRVYDSVVALRSATDRSAMAEKFTDPAFAVLFLEVDVKTAQRRIATRGNAAEVAAYDDDYLGSLCTHYAAAMALCAPILKTFDWNADVTLVPSLEQPDTTVLPFDAIQPVITALELCV